MDSLKNKAVKLLRASEKYTKTDMVYVAQNGFWVIFGQVALSAISFFLVFFFANYLPKETYGTYRYILSVAGIFNIFTLTGMNQAVAQAVADGKENVLKKSVLYQLKWNLLALIAFWITGLYYLVHKNEVLGLSLLILGVFSPLTAAFNTYGGFLTGKKQFRLNNIFSIISTLIYVVGMILAIVIGGKTIWLIVAYSLSTFIGTAIFYITTLRIFPQSSGKAEDKDVIGYGKKLTLLAVATPISSQLDSIILNHFWGSSLLAVYSIASTIPNRVITFIKGWLDVAFPKLVTRSVADLETSFYKRIFQGFAIGLVCTVFYILVIPLVFKYLAPKYLDAIFYSQILSISFIFSLPNRYFNLLFTAKKLVRLSVINSIIQNIILAFLYIILGIKGGIYGLIMAQVLFSAISFAINLIMWRLRNKVYKNKRG